MKNNKTSHDNKEAVVLRENTSGYSSSISDSTSQPCDAGRFDLLPVGNDLLLWSLLKWTAGNWEELACLSKADIQGHVDCKKIAILVATAHFQCGHIDLGREFIKLSLGLGCDRRVLGLVLASGVHNSLGQAAKINGDINSALNHFDKGTSIVFDQFEYKQWEKYRIFDHQVNAIRILPDLPGFSTYISRSISLHPDKNLDFRKIGISAEPIFVHSLWRSGSTYIFNVFRRSPFGYCSYQEPLHESILYPDMLGTAVSESLRFLRHPHLDKPYFYELIHEMSNWVGIPTKEMIYHEYFDNYISIPLLKYFSVLVGTSEGRPVINECRTSGRIGALKAAFGGKHIYLWRNPWDQWWSFKVDDYYFNNVWQVILASAHLPSVLLRIRQLINFIDFSDCDIRQELKYYYRRTLSARNSYLVFYAFWCLALIEGRQFADALVSIDLLSSCQAYRSHTTEKFIELGIAGLDFSDCDIPRGFYGRSDIDFFCEIEKQVHELLVSCGVAKQKVFDLVEMRRSHYVAVDYTSEPNVLRDLERSRSIVRQMEDRIARDSR